MASSYAQSERIATALERIAAVLEEQLELQKIPMLDAAAVLKQAAKEAQREQ